MQCCGSGSDLFGSPGSGSVSYKDTNPDPDPVKMGPDPQHGMHVFSAKLTFINSIDKNKLEERRNLIILFFTERERAAGDGAADSCPAPNLSRRTRQRRKSGQKS